MWVIAANFGELFEQYVRRSLYTPGQLAKLTGVPKMAIVNWGNGVHHRLNLYIRRATGGVNGLIKQGDRLIGC